VTVRTHLLHPYETLFRALGEYDDELEVYRTLLTFFDLSCRVCRFVCLCPRLEVLSRDREIYVVVRAYPLRALSRLLLVCICHLIFFIIICHLPIGLY